MRRFAPWVVIVVACGQKPSGPTPDAYCNDERNGVCCDGLGCDWAAGPLDVTVLDAATQQPVAGQPAFSTALVAGPIPVACTSTAMPCPSWEIAYGVNIGPQDVTVTVSGYAPSTFHVVMLGPIGCCGAGPTVTATVALTH